MRLSLVGLRKKQQEMIDSDARYKIGVCGRRWGKTLTGIVAAIACGYPGGRVWWVGPDFPRAMIAWREIRKRCKPYADVLLGEKRVEFPSGGFIQIKSSDDPDSLRGEGLDRVVMDEAALHADNVWEEMLRPSLMDRQGDAWFLSSPHGRNYFYELFVKAQSLSNWETWQAPSSENPLVTAEEQADVQATMSATLYRQEYLAEFLEDAGLLFGNVKGCVNASITDKYNPEHDYVFGVDWGKADDATVVVVYDINEHRAILVDIQRGVPYNIQCDKLEGLYLLYKPLAVIAEENSMGAALCDLLESRGLPIERVMTTNKSKAGYIDPLIVAFEKGEIEIPDDPTLIEELMRFECSRLPGGAYRYAAPKKKHDDTVIALGLAHQGASEYTDGNSIAIVWGRP